ncbi:MAG: rod shape-determining protein MreD [Clostridia bacterium]|nr:rod shape-determining protein MreD [Clostridia bacterium]
MRKLLAPLCLFAALVVQAAVFPVLLPGWILPDLVFCVAALTSIIGGFGPGLAAAAVGGLLQDAVTGVFIGANAGADMAAAAIIGFAEPKLFKENLITPAVMVGLGTIVRELVYLFLAGSFGARIFLARAALEVIPWMIALNCCVSALLYRWVYLAPRERARSIMM